MSERPISARNKYPKHFSLQDFRAGMNKYLTRHQYNNTYTEDLWAALKEASNKPVGEVMSSWTKQTGFPMISVTSHQDGDNKVLTLTQQRFLADGSTGEWLRKFCIRV